MKNNIIFSKIAANDWPQIIAIENQAYPNPWPLRVMHDCQRAGYQCIKGTLKAEPDEVVCYAFLMIGFEESNLLNISVNPKLQGQNIATQLLKHLLLISRINHAKTIWLEVRDSNLAAMRLYQKFKFEQIGRRKNYYIYQDASGKKVKEDALIMSRKVIL